MFKRCVKQFSVLAAVAEAVLLAVLLIGSAASAKAADQNIHALRSAYLYYFSHFIAWPADADFPSRKLYLCVRSDDEQDHFQLTTIDNKALGDNKLTIVLLEKSRTSDLQNCHMLYVAEDQKEWLASVRSLIPEKTLLITEGKAFHQGAIHLFTENNKLKFSIDNQALTEINLKASSKLLRLSSRSEG